MRAKENEKSQKYRKQSNRGVDMLYCVGCLMTTVLLSLQVKKTIEALLLQRDRATRLSVEILQLQNIPFEN